MDSTTNPNPEPNPNYLKIATQIATITVAVLATLTTLGAVLVFTIHSVIAMDVTPRFERLEIAVAGLQSGQDELVSRMDRMESGQQQIIELLKSGKR